MAQFETHKNVLIIDDDPVYQEIVRIFFLQYDAGNVFQAMDGKRAIEILAEPSNRIGLILCDIHMPGTSGIEFLEYASETKCPAPLAIVSSADRQLVRSAEILAEAYNLNWIGTLRKPVNLEKLSVWAEKYIAQVETLNIC